MALSCTHPHSDLQEEDNKASALQVESKFLFLLKLEKAVLLVPFSHGCKITTDLQIYIQVESWLVPVQIPVKCHLVI